MMMSGSYKLSCMNGMSYNGAPQGSVQVDGGRSGKKRRCEKGEREGLAI